MRKKRANCFMVSVKPSAILLEQYRCPKTCVPKIIFHYLHADLLNKAVQS